MKLRDVIEQKGDKILYQQKRRCDHPREWCARRTSILDQTYYHCYKCNSNIDKEFVGTTPESRGEMTDYFGLEI